LRLSTAVCLSFIALPALATPLSEAELKELLSGNTAVITHRNGAIQHAYFLPDGKARTNTRDGSVREASWAVERNRLCHDLSNPRKCYTVTKQGNAYLVESEDGQWKPSYAIEKGNLKNW
jgi:hypothetical protein